MDLTPKAPPPWWSFKRILNCCLLYEERAEGFFEEEAEEENLEDGAATHSSFCAYSFRKEPSFLYRLGVAVPLDVMRVRVHHSVEAFPVDSFRNLLSLREVILPEGLHEIGVRAFSGCTSLKNIYIPPTVTLIGDRAFQFCTSLKNVIIAEGPQNIGRFAFANCPLLEHVTLPSSLTAIRSYAFHGCASLADVRLMGGIITMGEGAFHSCDSLGSIAIPSKAIVIDTGFYLWTSGRFYPTMRKQAIIAPRCLKSAMNLKKLTNVVYNQWTGINSLARVRDIFAYNELVNVATILELALWKSRMDGCVPLAQEPLNVRNRATNIHLDPRKECRIRCGADVVIPNVLPFLWNYEREWPTIVF